MNARSISFALLGACCTLLPGSPGRADDAAATPGTTHVAPWKDNKQAAFTMGFDDSIPDQLTLVIPELQKRKMTATFYINPGKGEYQVMRAQWEKAAQTDAVVLGDHTMTHQGIKDYADAEKQIGDCADIILALGSGKKPRLISWGLPGVAPGHWNLSGDDLKKIMAEHNLIDRGDFRGHGAIIHEKTADEMVALADKALASGGVEYIVFHSVGPGTIPTPQPMFLEFLDKLESRHDKLWITDHISAYKYQTERSTAEVTITEATDGKIQLELKSQSDPQLYDQPLTLLTQVSVKATQYQVTQGEQKTTVPAVNGTIQYEALPNGGPIVIQPATS